MAEPTDPAELTKVQAQDAYNAAAAALIDAVTHWSAGEKNWSLAGVVSKEWYKLEYSLIAWVPDLPMDKVTFARSEFNELVERALDYNLDVMPLPVRWATSKRSKVTISPSQSRQDAAATGSQTVMLAPLPAPSKTTTPVPPPPKPTTPPPQKEKTPVPRKQQFTAPVTSNLQVAGPVPRLNLLAASPAAIALSSNVRASDSTAVDIAKPSMPRFTTLSNAQPSGRTSATHRKLMSFDKPEAVSNSGPSHSTEAFQKDWTSPLHSKPAQQLKTVPPVNATRSGASSPTPSRALAVNAANCPNIIQGPDTSLLHEGSVLVPSNDREPLFLPGTDDEEELADNISNLDDDEPVPPQDEPMDLDKDGPPSDVEELSPPPTNLAHRLRQEPRISFVFDEATGDFVEPHPTIFLPRLVTTPSQGQNLRRSTRSNTSPVNRDAAYLKTLLGSKFDATKKKKKDAKGKGQASETKAPRKRARTEEDPTQAKDKPALKKPKLKENVVIADDESAVATKVVHKRGPGLSKPPPVTLGVSGGGFGEKVPSSVKVVNNGIKSIGVLVVDNDFGDFVEVDKSYWSKAVTPFVGERYTTPCDHCRRLGTQCQKLLTHTVKCMRCHYSKLPCKVNGVVALNPIEHYRPKGSNAVNTFEAALNTIKANNAAIAEITQQYLAGLNIIAHTDSIRAQMFQLRGCLAPVDGDEEDNDGEGEEDEAPDDVAEGESGPSKKRKHK
ncbi:hypothetical protein ARMGADRAFT_1082413 [Armillaria gallica]|uniref:Zn(2)-C6 fungal-type domain-containing protein n=1 Tax=Armillaria gallica TaxID=47427 RepID=A0A2H3DNM5_ARMGA|nr:hypothetical protein ARMGADRAFT_1082413 [Armillaria gallica]